MKNITCKYCGKPSFGTESRHFCSTSCRVSNWQKEQRKKKPKSIVRGYKKPELKTSGHELIKAIAAIINLEEMWDAGDASAQDALGQIDNRINLIANKRRNTK